MTIVWTGSNSNLWNNSGNWNPQAVPGASDIAVIGAGFSVYTGGGIAMAGGLTLDATSTVTISDTASFQLSGTADNAGVIYATQGDSSALLIGNSLDAALTLEGGGQIVLAQAGAIMAGVGGASLDNIDNTIAGSGQIDGGILLTNGSAGNVLANSGGNATLAINGTQIVNDGTVGADAGSTLTVNYGASLDQSGGGTIAAEGSGAQVFLIGATVQGGTVESGNGGVVFAGRASAGLPVLDGSAGHAVTVGGSFVVQDSSVVSLEGVIDNTGTITANQGDSAQILIGIGSVAGVTLDGGGFVDLGQAGQINAGVAGATLDNVDNTIQGSGQIGGGITLDNQAGGIIVADNGNNSTLAVYDDAITNDGTIAAAAGSILALNYNSTVDQSGGGTIEATGSGADVFMDETTILGGLLLGTDGGIISAGRGDGTQPVLDGTGGHPVTNDASFIVDDSSVVTLAGVIHNQGSFTANQGDSAQILIGAASGSSVTLDSGGYVDLGQVGSIAPGATAATLDNIDNTIQGSGQIGGGLVIDNQAGGSIVADNGNNDTLAVYGDTITNDGTMAADAGSILSVRYGSIVDQSGGGTIEATGSGAEVLFDETTILGGTLESSDGGVIVAARGNGSQPLLDGSNGHAVTNDANYVITDSSVTSLEGVIHNEASFTANQPDGAILYVGGPGSSDVTLDSGGSVNLGQGGQIAAGIAAAELYNVNNTIQGSGLISGGLTVTNDRLGEILANSGTGNALDIYGAEVINDGLMAAEANSVMVLSYGAVIDQSSTAVVVTAPSSNSTVVGNILEAEGGGAVVELGLVTIEGGTLDTGGGGIIETLRTNNALPVLDGSDGHALTNLGEILITDSSDASLEGQIINSGEIVANQPDGAVIYIGGANASFVRLSGGGSIDLNQAGQIAAGVSGALLTNVDNTIQGSGLISGGLTVVNDRGGVIDANNAGSALNLYGPALVNAGLAEAGGGGTLNVNYGASVFNTGVFGAAPGGTTNAYTPVTNDGVVASNDGVVNLIGGISGTGSIEVLNYGLVVVDTATTMPAVFGPKGGTLRLNDPGGYYGTLSGVAVGSAIDLPTIPITPGNPNFPPPELSPPGDPFSSYWGNAQGLPQNYLSVNFVENAAGTGGTLTVYESAIYSWIDANNDNNYAGSAYDTFAIWSVNLTGTYTNSFGIGADNEGTGGSGISYSGTVPSFAWRSATSGTWQTGSNWVPAGGPPGLGDDVTLSHAGAYTVTDSQASTQIDLLTISDTQATLDVTGSSFTLNGASIAGAVQVQAGATLAAWGNLALGTTGSVAALGAAATVALDGGGITGGMLTLATGATLAANATTATIGGFATITDGGSVTAVNSGTLVLADSILHAGGGSVGATDGSGAAVVLAGATIEQGTLVAAAGNGLNTAAGSHDVLQQATLAAGSTLAITNGSTLTAETALANQGTLALGGGSAATVLAFFGDAMLDGGGTVTLAGPTDTLLADGQAATLNNADNSIVGIGNIGGGAGTLLLHNLPSGLIEANGGQLTINTGRPVRNTGTLSAAAGASLVVSDTLTSGGTLSAAGSIALNGGNDTLSGLIDGGGSLAATGVVQVTGSLVVASTTASFLSSVDVSGTLGVDGGSLAIGGAASGAGSYQISNGGTLGFAAGVASGSNVTFQASGGTLDVAAGSAFDATIAGFGAGATIDVTGLPESALTGETFQNGTLDLAATGSGASLAFSGSYGLDNFLFAPGNGGTGTLITFHS